jgi:arylsulfatase A-like enzyme
MFVLLDSLNRNTLKSYAKSSNILMPNFKRFQEKCITFYNYYVGSLPCISARRDLHMESAHPASGCVSKDSILGGFKEPLQPDALR